jgi:predicted nucleic acid-binding protein
MDKALFDASVYIRAWRERRSEFLVSRTWSGARVYLSAVVGAELLRGVRDTAARRAVRKLWRDFEKAKRLVIPQANDWHEAGVVLAQLARKHGYESLGQARLVHDVLIALSGRRLGITVVTLNLTDFERIAAFRRFALVSAADLPL